jgi:hypothetical protein
MTEDTVKALSDSELVNVISWAQVERDARTERRKRETIGRIKELAKSAGISVSVAGTRGRPKVQAHKRPIE